MGREAHAGVHRLPTRRKQIGPVASCSTVIKFPQLAHTP